MLFGFLCGSKSMEFNLKLKVDEITILGEALGNMPYKTVANLLVKIQQQINEQQQNAGNSNEPTN